MGTTTGGVARGPDQRTCPRSSAYARLVHRIGLIGHGVWGRLIHDRLTALGVDVVVVDPVVDGRPLSSDHPGSVDGFIVATPASTHGAVLDQLLDLPPVPVFCEKPFTTDLAAAERLARSFGDRIHLMHVWRYHPGVECLAEIARSGDLGQIHGMRSTRTNWTSPRADVDATWNLLPHDLTLAIEVLGHIPTPRSARAEVIDGRAVSVWADLGGPDEPWLMVEVSNRFGDKRREIRIHGSDAVAVLPDLDSTAVEITSGRGTEPSVERRHFDQAEPVTRELEAFLAFIDGGPAPKSDGLEGVDVVRAVEQIRALAGLDQTG